MTLPSRPQCCFCKAVGKVQRYRQMSVRLCGPCALEFGLDSGVVQSEMVEQLSERFNAICMEAA